ncbi:MAG: response regulator [Proteobacteria bacterium]|nr:response regulator [Pseudomonadota bacterium]
MNNILLVDNLKSSLVMTSEVFKDCIKGCQINIVRSGKECLDYLKKSSSNPDLVVVDFDLPDTDGVMLSRLLKKSYEGPVIITAFPDRVVDDAIAKELFVYNDSFSWVKKPVRLEEFSGVIEQFLTYNRRVTKRFATDLNILIGKKPVAGKTLEMMVGRMVDISMGGLKVHFPLENSCASFPMKERNQVAIHLTLPGKNTQEKTPSESQQPGLSKVHLKGKVVWQQKQKTDANGNYLVMGVKFLKLSDKNYNILESYMKRLVPIEDQIDQIIMPQAS